MENTAASSYTWSIENAIVQLAPDCWQIDLGFQGRQRVIAAYLLKGEDGFTLIESGPTSSLPNLLQALALLDVSPADLRRLLVTHIHLDHSGAAGVLARDNPSLTVYCHPFGLPHMVDPAKLVASATRIYTDQMETLWGEVAPVPADQMVAFEDGGTVRAGNRDLNVLITPGHAWHHVALFDPASGDLFTGDVAGIRMPGLDYVCPPTPPPDLDPDAWRSSVAAMRALRPRRLCLTHFGVYTDAAPHLDQIAPALARFIEIGERDLEAGLGQDDLADHLHAQMLADLASDDPEIITNYEWATPSYMAAMGITRYLTKRVQKQGA